MLVKEVLRQAFHAINENCSNYKKLSDDTHGEFGSVEIFNKDRKEKLKKWIETNKEIINNIVSTIVNKNYSHVNTLLKI